MWAIHALSDKEILRGKRAVIEADYCFYDNAVFFEEHCAATVIENGHGH